MCVQYKLIWLDGQWRWIELNTLARRIRDGEAFEIFPDHLAPVIRQNGEGKIELAEMRFGFPPPSLPGRPVVNVRNLDSPHWRPWLGPAHRCVVPATRFLEWTDARPKRAHWFALTGNRPLAFAGIWRPWRGVRGAKAKPVDGEHTLFAILTTAPNGLIRPIHAQAMPVVLESEAACRAWLSAPAEAALMLQRPLPEHEMLEVAA